MNKDKLSSWTLALSVILIVGGWASANNPDFQTTIAGSAGGFLLGVALAFVTWWLRASVRKEKEAAARAQREAESAAEAQRAEQKARAAAEQEQRRKERERFVYLRFPVAGVTFKNEDGTERQKILREIQLNEDAVTDVFFDEEEEKDGAIRVMTDTGCVGYIRRSDKEKVRRFFDHPVQGSQLETERFVNDDGEKIYRADVVIVMKRDEPEQQWYFDELQES